MNNIKNILIASLVSFVSFSCNDILDKGPLDKYSEDDVWNNKDLIQAFAYTTLSKSNELMVMVDEYTDNSVIEPNSSIISFNKEQMDRYYDVGWNRINDNLKIYENIRRCNMIIAKAPESPVLTDSEKAYFVAQAKAMRGMIYFSRARWFGKLMIVDRLLDPEEHMEFPRTATIKDTYDFILKDLQEAANDLPETLNNQQGMLTKGAAYALLAEAALHGAAYIESGQDEYYNIAKVASENLFNLGIYELDTNYKGMFNDFNSSLNSKEIILAQWKHEDATRFDGTWMQQLVPNTDNNKVKPGTVPTFVEEFAGWLQQMPSIDLVNAYEVIDEDGKAKDWDQTSYYKNFKENGGYVSDAIYKNRDNRFYASIVYDSTMFFKNEVWTRLGGNLNWASALGGGDWGMTKTGYIYRKCVYETKRLLNDQPTNYHYVLLRLGRSYLNYAEVMLRQGEINTAIDYINKTRTVHGGLPALEKGMSSEDVWKAYKRERRVELTMEGDRYWSLLRWGKADNLPIVKELTIVHKAIEIAADGKSFQIINLPFNEADNIRVFTTKRYLMPVPQKEIEENPSLDQNTGW